MYVRLVGVLGFREMGWTCFAIRILALLCANGLADALFDDLQRDQCELPVKLMTRFTDLAAGRFL